MKSSLYDRDVYDIREISGKGVGCIASQDIEKGTVILREKPQFAVKGKIKFFQESHNRFDEIFNLI